MVGPAFDFKVPGLFEIIDVRKQDLLDVKVPEIQEELDDIGDPKAEDNQNVLLQEIHLHDIYKQAGAIQPDIRETEAPVH